MKRIIENRFVMLLIDFWCNKIDDFDEKCEENKEIKRSYFNVKRDKRENVINDNFDFEIISIHDIDFFDVANIVTCDVIDVKNKKNGEINEINEIIFLLCFVRTKLNIVIEFRWITFTNKCFDLFFVIRIFSICCYCNWRVFSTNRLFLIHDDFVTMFFVKTFFVQCK